MALAIRFSRRQRGLQRSHQSFMDGLPLGEDPDAERWIEIVHAIQQPLVEPGGIEEDGMDSSALRQLHDALDVDLDMVIVEADGQTPGAETAEPCVFENLTQFTNDLAQRGTRLLLVRTTPQQADQPFATFPLGLRQREIAKHGCRLARAQFDRPPVQPQRKAAHQGDGKAWRSGRHGDGGVSYRSRCSA